MRESVLKRIIPRQRGIYPKGGSSGPPFTFDIARWLEFNSESLSAIDLKGDETRSLIPDRGITVDDVGGYVYFQTPITADNWVLSFRVNNNFILIGVTTAKIIVYFNDIQIDSNSINYETFSYSKLIENANVVGNAISLIIGEGLITTLSGVHYDYRLYVNVLDVNFYSTNIVKLINDTIESDDAYHRWLLTESNCTMAFDSGTAPLIHGTYIYTNINNPVETLHNTTIYPSFLKNKANKEGYNKVAYFNGTNGQISYTSINIANAQYLKIRGYCRMTTWTGITRQHIIGISNSDNLMFRAQSYAQYLNITLSDGVNSLSGDIGIGDITALLGYSILRKRFKYEFIFTKTGTTTGKLELLIDNVVVLTITGTFNNIPSYTLILGSKAVSYFFAGYMSDVEITVDSTVYSDPLNGSSIGTQSNIDFNRLIVPNFPSQLTDIFGRTPLYKGVAKLNSEVVGGKVARFASGQRYYQRTKYVGLPYVETCFYITQSDNIYVWFVENGATMVSDRLCQVIKESNNKISFYVFGSNGIVYFLSSTNTYLQYSSGCVKAWYDGNKLYLQIYSLAGVLLENKESTIGAITLRTATNDRITIGSNFWGFSMQGYLWNTIYKNNGVEVLNYAGNNLYNSITGVAATNNGVTFPLITTATPKSTIDWLKYGGYILSDGSKIPNPSFPLPVGAIQVLPKGYNFPDGAAINFKGLLTTGTIGDLNHSFFNFLSTVGNSLGLPEIHPISILPIVDITNPYYMTEAIYQYIIDNADSYPNEYKGFVYWLANYNIEHLLVYKTQKTYTEENTKLLKYKPSYYD